MQQHTRSTDSTEGIFSIRYWRLILSGIACAGFVAASSMAYENVMTRLSINECLTRMVIEVVLSKGTAELWKCYPNK